MSSVVTVPEFYSDRTLLVTGATGFLGQALIEKILRSCPNAKKIYLIIRENKKGNLSERFNRFLELEVFNRLRKENPGFAEKLCPLKGNLEEPNFGLTPDCYKDLSETVSVMFHSAASIKLDPPLREAIMTNILPMSHVITFVKDCSALDVFIHVSTFFSNMELGHIGEEIYPTSYSAQQLIEMCRTLDSKKIQKRRANILQGSLQTYVFTKKVTESMLADISQSVKVAVVRPALISPALNEPYPGWTYGYSAVNGVLKLIEKGMIRYVTFVDPNSAAEIVPVDLVVNNIIISAWSLGSKQHSLKSVDGPLVVNFASSTVNELLWVDWGKYVSAYHAEEGTPTNEVNLMESRMNMVLRCLWFGLATDIKSLAKCACTSHLKTQLLVLKMLEVFEPSMKLRVSKTFQNTDILEALLGKEDRNTFSMDLRKIDWEPYFRTCCRVIASRQNK